MGSAEDAAFTPAVVAACRPPASGMMRHPDRPGRVWVDVPAHAAHPGVWIAGGEPVMTSPSRLNPTTFAPPGPGSWVLDAVHVSRPFSRFQIEIHPPNLKAGFRECARRYGMLI